LTGARLSVSVDHRSLELSGRPFFYLGDTAWTLFKRLDRDEVELYLSNRAAKGFTVIQAYVVRGLEMRNRAGELPLVDHDPGRPNEGFFANVDHVVRRANEHGLVMGMVATLGEHVTHRPESIHYAPGEQVFTVDNARRFGEIMGRRYRDAALFWLLGGDRGPAPDDLAIWDAMAYGFKEGSQGEHLVSWHDGGGHSSSEMFHGRDWLDFNTVQSIHRSADPNYRLIAIDYSLAPVKPTLDMESRYEGHPDLRIQSQREVFGTDQEPVARIDPFQVREAAYWAVFAGAAGHGYGHNDLWQFHDPARGETQAEYSHPYIKPSNAWQVSMDAHGAFGVGYLRRLMEARPWYLAEPYPAIITAAPNDGEDRASALRARDGSFALVHLTWGSPVTVDLELLTPATVRCSWWDPRTGTGRAFEERPGAGQATFVPPTSGEGVDWVLVLDDPAMDPLPG
jgi:hypothetical protein